MIDESQSTPEKENTTNQSDSGETPIILKPHSAGPDEKNSSKYAQAAKYYISIAFDCVFDLFLWLIGWFWKVLRKPDFWIASATVAIAISTGIYTYYARKQWRAMTDQLTEMQKSTRSSEAAMVIDQRPWLKVFAGSPNPDRPEVTNIRITITINQPVSMPLTIRNIGKTAAQKILGYAIVEVVSMGKEPDIPDHQPPGFPQIDPPSAVPQKPTHAPTGFATSLIYPSDFFDLSIPRLRVSEQQSVVSPISEGEFESLRTGKSYFAVYGIVTYRDIFQVLHWSKFCKSIRADSVEMLPSQSVTCANYTAVDDNTK